MKLPANLQPEAVTAIVDTREQTPLDLAPLRVQTATLGIGSLLGWQAMGLSVHLVGDHERAGKHCARLLYQVARKRYRELRALVSLHGEPT
jgi:hypothetical protein